MIYIYLCGFIGTNDCFCNYWLLAKIIQSNLFLVIILLHLGLYSFCSPVASMGRPVPIFQEYNNTNNIFNCNQYGDLKSIGKIRS